MGVWQWQLPGTSSVRPCAQCLGWSSATATGVHSLPVRGEAWAGDDGAPVDNVGQVAGAMQARAGGRRVARGCLRRSNRTLPHLQPPPVTHWP